MAILPGSEFGRPDHELTARLAYVDFDGGKALDAVPVGAKDSPDEALLRDVATKVCTAIDKLVDWLPG